MLIVEFRNLKGETSTETYPSLEEAMSRFVDYVGDGQATQRIRLLRATVQGPEILRHKYVGPHADVFED